MNREEEIERFRNEKLPEYIKLAENEPWVVEKPIKFENLIYKKCHRCKQEKRATEFYGRYQHVCKECKNKYQMKRYYGKRVEHYKEKLQQYK